MPRRDGRGAQLERTITFALRPVAFQLHGRVTQNDTTVSKGSGTHLKSRICDMQFCRKGSDLLVCYLPPANDTGDIFWLNESQVHVSVGIDLTCRKRSYYTPFPLITPIPKLTEK
jgi:hypothetical protein